MSASTKPMQRFPSFIGRGHSESVSIWRYQEDRVKPVFSSTEVRRIIRCCRMVSPDAVEVMRQASVYDWCFRRNRILQILFGILYPALMAYSNAFDRDSFLFFIGIEKVRTVCDDFVCLRLVKSGLA